jgi:hypothetical protein
VFDCGTEPVWPHSEGLTFGEPDTVIVPLIDSVELLLLVIDWPKDRVYSNVVACAELD